MNARAGWIWLPRVLALLFLVFLSLFAFDVFGGSETRLQQAVGFVVHLTPVFVLAVSLVLTWRRPKLAGWLFIAIGVLFTVYFQTLTMGTFAVVSLPPLVIGALFLLAAWFGKHA